MAERLGLEPHVVLRWRESELALWMSVMEKHRRTELLWEMTALACAVWDQKALAKMLGSGRAVARMSQAEIQAALAKAERTAGMRMRAGTIDELKRVAGK